ncbi:MAG: YbhB/YbcL family Raf kinase inhibitor-like protein [Sandaracinaceae bacterium]
MRDHQHRGIGVELSAVTCAELHPKASLILLSGARGGRLLPEGRLRAASVRGILREGLPGAPGSGAARARRLRYRRPMRASLGLLLLLAGCSSTAEVDAGPPPADAAVADAGSDAGAATDAGADAGADTDAGADAGADAGLTTALQLTSAAFDEGAPIPVTPYACTATEPGVSVPLAWTGAPAGTMSFALLMDDPDAFGFDHWVLFDVPASTAALAMGEVPSGALEGVNGFGRSGYAGPCPPSGTGTHHYRFRLFALEVASLGLAAGASLASVEAATDGHVLAEATLTGTVEGMF